MKRFLISALLASTTFLEANLADLNTIESSFTQSITNEQHTKITYSGKMYAVKKDNQALWEYHKPIVKKIYYKAGNIVIIEPELEQAIFAKLNKVPNVLILLQNATQVSDHVFETTFNKIKYTIETEKDHVKKIAYVDEIQNKVVIEFSDQTTNTKIDPSTFVFEIPEEYDVLEQ